jgi:hypothetical protein
VRRYPALVAAVGSLVVVAGVLSGLAQTDAVLAASTTPTPGPTSTRDIPISVIIPEQPTSPPTTPSPSSTPRPSNSGAPGGGGGGATTCPAIVDGEAPTPAAQPSDKAGKLTLDPTKTYADEWIVAKGNGYTPGEMVQLAVYPGGVAVGSFKADAGGNITARFRVPVDTRPGDHVVEGAGWQSCFANRADFSVVSDSAGAAFPYLWWVAIVLGVIVLGLIVLAIYFRDSIRRWFGGGLRPAEPVT